MKSCHMHHASCIPMLCSCCGLRTYQRDRMHHVDTVCKQRVGLCIVIAALEKSGRTFNCTICHHVSCIMYQYHAVGINSSQGSGNQNRMTCVEL